MRYIFDLHQTMVDQHLILVYEGEFTQEITKSVLSMAERNMDSTGEESSIKRKVFNVMVECLQNIVKHADQEEKDNAAIFLIGRNADSYLIISGNPIKKEDKGVLTENLEKINSLDKEGLKELYKNIITWPENQGANWIMNLLTRKMALHSSVSNALFHVLNFTYCLIKKLNE